ncbi:MULTISPECIES: hypothetical protein [unclassified Leifsonia]|uniref:hypothetical protein n=1 Tax=unclassified Leifsonia TaxID=2663824 RepID=UPI0008A810A1|nr:MULTISPECIES: hypothetical protein [unclassified Leifsonia]SEH86085.1 hypothetical protein SAMN04515694_105144 [Leifsonia sp. CL154]SFL48514.1 hypothetical protein SAMN04515692_105144 [Leifsonia sp. CL147]
MTVLEDSRVRSGLRKARRLIVGLAVATALVTASSGCSLIGEFVEQQNVTPEQSLKYQREVALEFIKFQPDVEVITYTSAGGRLGSGEWAADAVVTIGGKKYREGLGTIVFGGDELPVTPPSFTPGPVTVNYSDGTSEVLR